MKITSWICVESWKYEDHLLEEEENTQAPRWSEWAEEAERMEQIAKKEKEEILAGLEAGRKRTELKNWN